MTEEEAEENRSEGPTKKEETGYKMAENGLTRKGKFRASERK